jgi:SWI/SNF-related matrix-associated actin-dependent regulator of chromatin subfamily A3
LARNVVVLDGWVEEVQKYNNGFHIIPTIANSSLRHVLPNTLNMHIYHGSKRESDSLKLLAFDIIFTTYATVAAEFRHCSNVLHSINWFRIVLDEGRLTNSLLFYPQTS